MFDTETIRSTNYLVHYVETLPALPPSGRYIQLFHKEVVLAALDQTHRATVWLKDAHRFGDLQEQDYVRLCDALRLYRQNLRGLIAPFNRCPPEIVVRIFKYTTPEVILDDFPRSANRPLPAFYCPQLMVLARVSRAFNSIISAHPTFFSTIRLRRRIQCGAHPPIVSERLSRLLRLSAARPLDIIIEFVDHGNYWPPMPKVVQLQPCSTIVQLKQKPWKKFLVFGASYVAAAVITDRNFFPAPIAQSLTAIHLCILSSLDDFLETLMQCVIPLNHLSITSTQDCSEVPNLNHSMRLPDTLRHIRIEGGSRTALYLLRAATQVLSATVVLTNGLDSISGNWQINGCANHACKDRCLHSPITLPRMTTLYVSDGDYFRHVCPDLLRWINLPVLHTFALTWDTTSHLTTIYISALNSFFDRNTSISQVLLTGTPVDRTIRAGPQCIIRHYPAPPSSDRYSPAGSDYDYNEYDESDGTLSDASLDFIEAMEPRTPGYSVWF
ncbi:hypothetical protein VNI00_015924 [Paramarasmius palmivorus]|uniref:F-box domain-containing protein n=1 Tax=Paramarasmius palmivorus TaxID=297713 RepID=A0AAW0BJK1_9AGAR